MVMGNPQGNNLNTAFTFSTQGAPQAQQAVNNMTRSLNQFVATSTQTGQAGGGGFGQVVQQSQTFRQNLDAAAKSIQQVAQQSGAQFSRIPTFLQFSLFPLASLAGGLGAGGAAQGLMTGAAFAGVLDNLQVLDDQLAEFALRLQATGGVIGRLASLGGALASPLGGMATALGSILAVAVPVAAVIGGVALVFGELQKRLQAVEEKAKDAADELARQADLVATGATTEEVQAQVDEDTTRRDFVGDRLTTLQAVNEEIGSLFDALGRISQQAPISSGEQLAALESQRLNAEALLQYYFGLASDLTNQEITTQQELQAIIGTSQQYYDGLNDSIEENTNLINSGALAYNDQQAALEESLRQQDLWNEAQIDVFRRGREMSTEELEKWRDTIQADIELIEASYEGLTSEGQKAADDQILQLHAVAEALDKLIPDTFLERLQRAIPAFQELQKEIDRLTSDFILEQQRALADRDLESSREAFDFSRDRIRDIEDFNRDLAQSDRDYQEDRQQSIADFYAALAEEESDQSEEDLDRLAKFNREEARRLEDHQDRLSKIVRDANDDVETAIGERDALAAFKAAEKAKKDIADEQEQYEKQRKRRLEDFQLQTEDQDKNDDRARQRRIRAFERQLADQEQQHNRERQRRLADFRQRLADEDADRRIRLQRQAEDFRRQELLREQDFNRRIQQMRNQFLIEQGLNTAFLGEVTHLMDGVRTRVENGINAIFNRGRTGTQIGPQLPPPNYTAPNPFLNIPFQFTSQTQPNAFGNANTRGTTALTVNMNGATLQTIDTRSRKQVFDVISKKLDELGVA
jgi:hypothetical protein